MTFISYAQNFEDVLLWRALKHIDNGFYLDIGAQDPIVDSVSRAFYNAGWRGTHVEATPTYASMLRMDRPDEMVLEAAVSDHPGIIAFYEFPETGLSTGSRAIANAHVANGFHVREMTVPCLTLSNLFDQIGEREIHWMKIDVEGMEGKVLAGWGSHTKKPWILVIESTVPLSTEQSHQSWIQEVLNRGYEEAFFDGLSRYFISEHHMDLKDAFYAPANVFDDFALNGTASSNLCLILNENLKSSEQHASKVSQQLAALQDRQREASLISRKIMREHARSVRNLHREHALSVAKLTHEHASLIAILTNEHASSITKLGDEHASLIATRTEEHSKALQIERSCRVAAESLLQQQRISYDRAQAELNRIQKSLAWRIVRKIGLISMPIASDEGLVNSLMQSKGEDDIMQNSQLPTDDSIITLSDFGDLHDAEFVHQAYRLLLKRDPDPVGQQHYLTQIRSGYSKSEIVVNLAGSSEAKAAGVKVSGAGRYRTMRSLCSIPIIGRILEGFIFLFYAREFTKEVRALENYTYRLKVHLDRMSP